MSSYTDSLINAYTNVKKDADFNSAEFKSILACINNVLADNKKDLILDYKSAPIGRSIYDTGKFGNKSLWRVTSEMFPELLGYPLLQQIKKAVESQFKHYVDEKTIVIGPYQSKRDNMWHNSIKILVGSLSDNTFTREDLLNYGKDPEVTARLNDLETRFYRRPSDARSPEKRWLDFKVAMKYEDELPKLNLDSISNLKLRHNNDVFTMDPDYSTDFIGTVRGVLNVKIEGKSTSDTFKYINTPNGKIAYGNYFKKLLANSTEAGGIGSIHNADYVLLVNKTYGSIVCINAKDYSDNWLAGTIDLKKLYND